MDYIRKIKEEIKKEKVYIVGGYLRDYLLGLEGNDLDLIVIGELKSLLVRVAKRIGGSYFELGNNKGEIMRLITPEGYQIDFATVQESLQEDLLKRDITINTLAYDLQDYNGGIKEENVIDIVEGKRDLKAGIIRIVKEENIANDPLRVLRALRIAAKLNFNLAIETKQIIQKYSSDLDKVAGERMAVEIKKLLSYVEIIPYIKEGVKLKIWYQIFKEEPSEKNLEQLKYFNQLIESLEEEVIDYLAEKVGDFSKLELLRLATLISKDNISLITSNLKLSNKADKLLEILLQHRKLVKKITNNLTKVSFYNYYSQVGRDGIGLILVTSTEDDSITLNFIKQVLEYYQQEDLVSPPQLITGKDLIQELELTPGPIIGEILIKIELAQIKGEIINYDQALKRAQKLIRNLDK